ncbi:hypothetical protein CORC01_11294 [Colletotrichum orchidophilum]|uniref:SnoaL-like domain-containing protein n=1 Tax=Colletotrichum orchidophilum TaxID=1209926 RepID=A0A1G4AW91_9PEZI|nr:uncharacterized protein CORC01_11294 [Colletotrichum orchidophilum]OHE93429.1 hypothetical protein CORC01_11294 [Colletotrichum orchidophilum]
MVTIPNTQAEALAWLNYSHEIHDSLRTTDFDKIYSKNAQLKFTNFPIAEGLHAIKQIMNSAFAQLSYMKHVTRQADKVDNRIWLTVDITYRVKGDPDNEDINIPAAGLVTIVTVGEEAGKIARFDVFLDNTTVREKIAAYAELRS